MKGQMHYFYNTYESKVGDVMHEDGMKHIIQWYRDQPHITNVSGEYTCSIKGPDKCAQFIF